VVVSQVPDQGMLRRLGGWFNLALAATTAEFTIADYLGDMDARPERVVVDAVPSAAPTGPIGQSRTVTDGAVDGPSSFATFGGSWLPSF
jgi:hypothetical protein